LKKDKKSRGDLKLRFFNSNHRELIKLYGSPMEHKEFLSRKDKILKVNNTGTVKSDTLYKLYVWENK